MNTITHAIIGLALSEILMLNPLIVVIGALLPDLDYVVGITHRTITHSLLFMIPLCLIVWKLKGKRQGYALLIGLSSHLMLDAITIQGIPLLYPLGGYYSFNLTRSLDYLANLAFVLIAAVLIINKNSIHEYLFSLKKGQALKWVSGFIIGFFALLFLFPLNTCPGIISDINKVKALSSETSVSVKGTICSEVNHSTSKSGNNYQIFNLCDDTGNITIWKGEWVLENNLSKGDLIQLCGKFTTKFAVPEIYYIESVTK